MQLSTHAISSAAAQSRKSLLCSVVAVPDCLFCNYLVILCLQERAIAANHDKLQNSWEQHKKDLQATLGPETSIEDLRYAMALLVTRLFELGEDGLRLVPLLDMANHW
jgi:hypothetical protein